MVSLLLQVLLCNNCMPPGQTPRRQEHMHIKCTPRHPYMHAEEVKSSDSARQFLLHMSSSFFFFLTTPLKL